MSERRQLLLRWKLGTFSSWGVLSSWRNGVRDCVANRLQGVEICKHGLQVIACHLRKCLPRHWWENVPALTHILSRSHGFDENVFCPASQTGSCVRC